MKFYEYPESPSRPLRFLALEGVDGCGKTTQAALLADWFRSMGRTVVLTREPGGTIIGEHLRTLIKDPNIPCSPLTELMLLLAGRAQHIADVINPAIEAGSLVISDRFSLSTMAYQAGGRNLSVPLVKAADAAATGGLHPDCNIFLDVPLDVALSRIGVRDDRFEAEGPRFLQRVINVYHGAAEWDPSVLRIDGTGPEDAVQQAIRNGLTTRFGAE
jgi:dTMP kinase